MSLINPNEERVVWLTRPPRQIFEWAGQGRGGETPANEFFVVTEDFINIVTEDDIQIITEDFT